MEIIIELLLEFKWAVMASVLMGCVLPVFGVYFIMKRMVLMGVALPHVASAGIALAMLIAQRVRLLTLQPGQTPFLNEESLVLLAPIGSFIAIMIVLGIFTVCENRGNSFTEARWGTTYITATALMVILLVMNPYAESHVATMLEGRVITVTSGQLLALFIMGTVVVVIFAISNKGILLTSFDPDMAKSMGFKIINWNITHYLMFGIIISICVMILGPMFVFGYLLLPAFAVRPWIAGMRRFFICSAIVGGISAFIGVVLSLWFNWPLGPTEVLAASVVLIISRIAHLAFRGLNRKRTIVAGS